VGRKLTVVVPAANAMIGGSGIARLAINALMKPPSLAKVAGVAGGGWF